MYICEHPARLETGTIGMTGSLSPTAAAADVVSNAAGKGAGVDKLIQASRFVDAVVDFIRVYADRTYHGREEDILFRDF